jgi:magnesium chelatase family protein
VISVMHCASICGFQASRVMVEVDISRGLPRFDVVGLAENSVKEARVRVQSAIKNSGFDFPRGKISVNLAPADIEKNGTAFDLSIALALLVASGIMPKTKLSGIAVVGELSMTGEIRPVRGMLAIAESIKEQGLKTLIVAKENGSEASLIHDLDVRVAHNLSQIVDVILQEKIELLPKAEIKEEALEDFNIDMTDVVGQEEARRALLIAAAGDHNLLFVGGPGSGKSMMAHRMPTILPPLSYEESMVLTKIYSIAGLTIRGDLIKNRPFRSPHHSITKAGLAGGGHGIRPGEISLASFGVLFLDELLEFPHAVLEILRQPIEDGQITICRANNSVTYPAKLSIIGALNPCPCGFFGQGKKPCTCSNMAIERYQSKLSGPMMDRIDLHVQVPPVNLTDMASGRFESSKSMRDKVIKARAWQRKRVGFNLTNGKMSRADIKNFANLPDSSMNFLLKCGEKLSVSARGFDRLIRVSRTIADLDESSEIKEPHIAEALQFRPSSLVKR